MDTNAAPVVSPLPDNISASGARRVHAEAGHETHTKKSIPSEDAGDPLDGLREQSLRKETGQAARYHERLDHAAARAAKQVDTPESLKHVRRAGFGSMSACPWLMREPAHFGACRDGAARQRDAATDRWRQGLVIVDAMRGCACDARFCSLRRALCAR
jgi:hypothetical protein